MTDRKIQNKNQDSEDKGQSSKALAQTLGKFIALALVVILALLIEHYCSYKPPAFGPDAKITAIDGDSLRAGNGDEYRLFGIDAPELHQSCKDSSGKSWLCGRAAKAKLTTLMKAGAINCEAKAADRYNRIVAVCSAQGVPDLGEAMVSSGYAIDLGGEAGNPYRSAESEAKDAKRGIWRGTFDRPSDWRQSHPREGDSSDRGGPAMPGKRVQFDDETWQAIDGLATTLGKSFQALADEAFKDLLKKHRQPVGLKAALKESIAAPDKPARKKS